MTAVDREVLAWVASLAQIELDPNETDQLTDELGAVLDFVAQLNEVDTKDITPMPRSIDAFSGVTGSGVTDSGLSQDAEGLSGGVYRRDEAVTRDDRHDLLANAPAQTAGFLIVPKVVE